MNRTVRIITFVILITSFFKVSRAEDSAWVSLLNGKDLAGWTPYFQKTLLTNSDSTYRVTPEGWLDVHIHLPFATTGFGHLFYTKRKYSYYMVRAVYRFTSTTYGAPDWAQGWNLQNNGIMVHSQDPGTMKGKDFPTSFEVQLLGPKNQAEPASADWPVGHTANLCTPGTFVAWNGNANYTQHCTTAQYPDAWKKTNIPFEDPDGWSDVTARVLADSMAQHWIHGAKVFEYTKLRTDDGKPLSEGYISVQAEGTPTQFKSIEVLDLVGCTDKSKPAYRSYFVKSDPAACNVATGVSAREGAGWPGLTRAGDRLMVKEAGASIASVRRADGSRVPVAAGARAFAPDRAGLYLVSIRSAAGVTVRKAVWP